MNIRRSGANRLRSKLTLTPLFRRRRPDLDGFRSAHGAGKERPTTGAGDLTGRVLPRIGIRHRLPDHQPCAGVRIERPAASRVADRGRDSNQPCTQHRHGGQTHRPCGGECRTQHAGGSAGEAGDALRDGVLTGSAVFPPFAAGTQALVWIDGGMALLSRYSPTALIGGHPTGCAGPISP